MFFLYHFCFLVAKGAIWAKRPDDAHRHDFLNDALFYRTFVSALNAFRHGQCCLKLSLNLQNAKQFERKMMQDMFFHAVALGLQLSTAPKTNLVHGICGGKMILNSKKPTQANLNSLLAFRGSKEYHSVHAETRSWK